MGKIIFVTGGSRSGKSSFSEKILKKHDDVLYIATATVTDKEMAHRVKRHKEMRNKNWITHEGFINLDEVIESYKGTYIMLDCVTNMLSNLMFYFEKNIDDISNEEKDILFNKIKREFEKLINSILNSQNKTLILVSNEVGMGLVSEYKLGRIFSDFQGFINQYIAKCAQDVVFMVSGLPLILKKDNKVINEVEY